MLKDMLITNKIARKNYRDMITPSKIKNPASIMLPELASLKNSSHTQASVLEAMLGGGYTPQQNSR